MGKSEIKIVPFNKLGGMRAACALAAETLLHIAPLVKVGTTLNQIDEAVEAFARANGATSGPLGYCPEGMTPYPKSCCTSINSVVCHGIPDDYALVDGDIVNVDVTPVLDGWYGDTSATFYVGTPSPEARRLVETTRRCLDVGIAQVRNNASLMDIGKAIEEVATKEGYSVVRAFGGHGIGREFHTQPHVAHYADKFFDRKMKTSWIFTIEPMINAGDSAVNLLPNKWTAVTTDGSLSAQFEHTVRVTPDGCEVLTQRNRPLVNSEV